MMSNKWTKFSTLLPILTIVGVGIFFIFYSEYKRNSFYNWSSIRKEIKDSLKIARFAITDGSGGMGISTKGEINRRKWVMDNATESELKKLIEYPNGVIKAIAYEGLLRKKGFTQKTELTIKAINDTIHLIDYQSGCSGWNMTIGQYLVQNVLLIDDKIPPPPIIPDFGLTKKDKEKILLEFRKRQKSQY